MDVNVVKFKKKVNVVYYVDVSKVWEGYVSFLRHPHLITILHVNIKKNNKKDIKQIAKNAKIILVK